MLTGGRLLAVGAAGAVALAALVVAATAIRSDREPPSPQPTPAIALVGVQEVRLDCDPTCRFDPERLVVEVGTQVRWVNDGDAFHTVTSSDPATPVSPDGRFDQSVVGEGDAVERTFDSPGIFHFFCQPHSDTMRGIIEVVG